MPVPSMDAILTRLLGNFSVVLLYVSCVLDVKKASTHPNVGDCS